LDLFSIFGYSKLEFGLVKISSFYEVDIHTQSKIFVTGDVRKFISRVRKYGALSQKHDRLAKKRFLWSQK
jgi:hypothetical protein